MRTLTRILLATGVLAACALPARAESVTIDSQNCSDDCFGLSWTLTINELLGPWGFEAILDVSDDFAVSGTPSHTISSVDLKVGSSVDDAVLVAAPTALASWNTYINVLNSAGCTGPEAGFVCSQSGTAPASFTGSTLTWTWYFNTSAPIFEGLNGAHIGAKLTTLDKPGKLLSEEFTTVPEPASLTLLGLGLAACVAGRRRTRTV